MMEAGRASRAKHHDACMAPGTWELACRRCPIRMVLAEKQAFAQPVWGGPWLARQEMWRLDKRSARHLGISRPSLTDLAHLTTRYRLHLLRALFGILPTPTPTES